MAGRSATPSVRRAVSLFSARAFRPVLAAGEAIELRETMDRLRAELSLPKAASNGTVVDAAYALLASSHRSEYVYKNLLANKIFVGRHRATNSVLLQEFRVGSAVADSVFVNGKGTVYEIKTELDNPDKLERQLSEYFRAFPIVNVVVHESVLDRYEGRLRNTPAGLMAVGQRWRLSTVKAAEEDFSSLDIRTMFNTLRVREVEAVLKGLGFDLPAVPNGVRYERHLALALQVPVFDFHKAYRTVIKGRQLSGDISLYRDRRLISLSALLVQLDPSSAEGENLLAWLSTGE